MSASCSGHARDRTSSTSASPRPGAPFQQRERPAGAGARHRSSEDRRHAVSRRAPRCPPTTRPCDIPFGCGGTPWYGFDPALARETLAAAGYPQGFETTHSLPDDGSAVPVRPGWPGVATEVQTQLQDNLGITATPGGRARRDVRRRRRRRQDPGDLPRQPDSHVSGTVSSFLDPTFGPGPRRRPWASLSPTWSRLSPRGVERRYGPSGEAGLRPGQQRHPQPRPDDPDRADRLHGGAPRRRRWGRSSHRSGRSGSRP